MLFRSAEVIRGTSIPFMVDFTSIMAEGSASLLSSLMLTWAKAAVSVQRKATHKAKQFLMVCNVNYKQMNQRSRRQRSVKPFALS